MHAKLASAGASWKHKKSRPLWPAFFVSAALLCTLLVLLPTSGSLTAAPKTKIVHGTTNGSMLTVNDKFGQSMANAGDLDGSGGRVLVVGASGARGSSSQYVCPSEFPRDIMCLGWTEAGPPCYGVRVEDYGTVVLLVLCPIIANCVSYADRRLH